MQLLKELQGVGDPESLDPGLGGARDTPTALQDLRNPTGDPGSFRVGAARPATQAAPQGCSLQADSSLGG